MNFQRSLQILCVGAMALACLASCAGIGYVRSDDPYVKLAQAQDAGYNYGRFELADRLTDEAEQILRERGDVSGISQALTQRGHTLASKAAWVLVRRGNGPDATAIEAEFLNQALQNFGVAERYSKQFGLQDALSNVYLGKAMAHHALGRTFAACRSLDDAQNSSRLYRKQHPEVTLYFPKSSSDGKASFQSIDDYYRYTAAQLGC